MEKDMEKELVGEIIEIRKNRRIFLIHHSHETSQEDTTTYFFHHGAGGRCEQFILYMKHFSKQGFNVVGFDMLGHHRSSKPTGWGVYSTKEFVLDFVAIFRTYRTRKNNIVCHSFGTSICQLAISKYFNEEDLKSINNVNLIATSNEYSVSFIFYFPSWVTGIFRSIISSKFVKMAFHEKTSEEIIKYEVSMSGKNDLSMMKSLCRQLQFPSEEDHKRIMSKLKEINHQIFFFVISGETDGIFPPKNGRIVSGRLNGEFVVVKNTSHNLLVEKPEIVIKLIEDFDGRKKKVEEEEEGENED